jgi:hypothetical protein
MNNYNFIVPAFLPVMLCCSKYVPSFHLGILTGLVYIFDLRLSRKFEAPYCGCGITFIIACAFRKVLTSTAHRQVYRSASQPE